MRQAEVNVFPLKPRSYIPLWYKLKNRRFALVQSKFHTNPPCTLVTPSLSPPPLSSPLLHTIQYVRSIINPFILKGQAEAANINGSWMIMIYIHIRSTEGVHHSNEFELCLISRIYGVQSTENWPTLTFPDLAMYVHVSMLPLEHIGNQRQDTEYIQHIVV